MKKTLLIPFLMALNSYADNTNVLSCKYNKYYKTACQINEVTLAENESFHMDYEVSYIYDCQGHSFEVGVQTETGFYPFQRGKGVQTLTATGQARLFTSTTNKTNLYSKVFQKSCTIEITDVKKRPSVQSLLNWQNQSDALIRLLYAELDNYFLAKSLDEITSWNKQKLYLMKTNLQKVVRVYPYNPHFKLLLNTVQKAMENSPAPYIPQDAKDSIVNYYKSNLQKELGNAQQLYDNFSHWQTELRNDLKEAISHVKEYMN